MLWLQTNYEKTTQRISPLMDRAKRCHNHMQKGYFTV